MVRSRTALRLIVPTLLVFGGGAPASAQPAGAAGAATPCRAIEGRQWASVASGQHPFRVWATCTAGYEAALQAALTLTESKWSAIGTYLKREPLRDLGGRGADVGDEVDLYLVDVPDGATDPAAAALYEAEVDRPNADLCALPRAYETAPRGGKCFAIAADAVAQVFPILPVTAGKSSAILLLRRNQLGTQDFVFSLTHELFHAFQLAFNQEAAIPTGGPLHWFVDASAVWAEWNFNRGNPAVATSVHAQKFKRFQEDDRSLHDPLRGHTYAAYVWPVFMTVGAGADKVAAAWLAMDGKTDSQGLDDAIDQQVPFVENFRKFALRNLNATFDGVDPGITRYTNPDPGFPAVEAMYAQPPQTLPAQPAGTPPLDLQVKVPTLRAHYYRFTVDDAVEQLDLDFGNLQESGALDIDALLDIRDRSWVVRPLAGKVRFCRSDADDHLDSLVLVLSNHSRDPQPVAGTLSVTPSAEACTGWRGEITYTETAAVSSTHQSDCTTITGLSGSKASGSIRVRGDVVSYELSFDSSDDERQSGCREGSYVVTQSASGGGTPEVEIKIAPPEDVPHYEISFTMPEVQGTESSELDSPDGPLFDHSSADAFSFGQSGQVSCYAPTSAKPPLRVVTADTTAAGADVSRNTCEVDSWDDPTLISGTWESTVACSNGTPPTHCYDGETKSRKIVVTWRLTRK